MRDFVVALVGGGPRGTGLLERIAASAPELLPPERPLTIHLVDPHPPGGGRVWRHEQSALLRMNSMAEDVTMFTDERSTIEGPVSPGPSLAEWAARAPEARHHPDEAVRAELTALAPTDFPTRRAQSAYLGWVYDRARAELPPWVLVREQRVAAVELGEDAGDGHQTVRLADGRVLHADLVVLSLGHLDATPTPEEDRLAAFANRHGLRYLPPDYTADSDLDALGAGEDVLLRGFGLAFVDLVVLLTEGRGGRYSAGPGGSEGELVYHPSGREPVLHVGSRRGVPYHAKTGYRLQGPPPPLPRFFTAAVVDRLIGSGVALDFRSDVWPLLAKEIGWGYYHELFQSHPERTTSLDQDTFADAYARLDWYSEAMTALVAAAVPDAADRLDFERLDHPLAGLSFTSEADFTAHLSGHIRADLARRGDPEHSADLGAFHALLSIYAHLPRLAASGRLRPESLRRDVDGWWQGFFSFLASGPPPFRLRELLALSRAGVLRFLGPDVGVRADEERGRFLASSPAVAGHVVAATALVEARLPRPTLANTASPLLRSLRDGGELTEDNATGLIATRHEDGALLRPDGTPHPRRLALGAPTNARAVAAFSRPRSNSPAFQQNDAVARHILRLAASPGAREGGRQRVDSGQAQG